MAIDSSVETEIKEFLQNYWDTYFEGDLKKWGTFITDDYKNIGTTEEEIWNSKKDILDYTKEMIDQMVGNAEVRNKKVQVNSYPPYFMAHELGDLFVKSEDEWLYYAPIRLSSLMQKNGDTWIVLHQHGSFPDSKTEEGEAFGIDTLKEENLKLQKAVQERTVELEQRNRALEIESALQRIRAEAVGMRESADLQDIVVTMRKEFVKLGHEAHYFWHMMWLDDRYEKAMTSGDGSRVGMVMNLPRDFHTKYEQTVAWEKSDEPVHVLAMGTEVAVDYIDRMVSLGNFKKLDPNAPTQDDIRHIGGLTFVMARTTHGEIGYSLPGVVEYPSADALQLLERFASTFDLAHRRFLDLQKSERQAFEVKIELELEKVRSRAMAMHQSIEIGEVAEVLYEQLTGLEGDLWGTGFAFCEVNSDSDEFWFVNHGGVLPNLKMPNTVDPAHIAMYQGFLDQLELLTIEKGGEDLEEHYRYMLTVPSVQPVFQGMLEAGIDFPKWQKWHAAYFKYGYLLVITTETYENEEIFVRFAKVFEQAYIRFLDLKKAEAQAREAQIEHALEKVRGRTMAMQHSDELAEVASLIYFQTKALGIDTFSSGFTIWSEDEADLISWMCNADGSVNPPFTMPISENKWHLEQFQSWKDGKEFIKKDLKGQTMKSYLNYLRSFPSLNEAFEISLAAGHPLPERQVHYVANFSHGNLLFITLEPKQGVDDIFKRFAKVFDQTYTRFLDLQKAEVQARKAQIEAALEKVRSRSLAVTKSDQLHEVVTVLFEKLKELDFPIGSVTLATFKEGSKDWNVFGCGESENGLKAMNFNLPYFSNAFIDDILKAKSRKESGYHSKVYSEEEKNKYYEFVFNNTALKNLPEEIKESVWQSKTYALSTAFARHSTIMVNEFNGKVLDGEQAEVLMKFSRLFEQVYIRFMDLQKAEEQARQAQIEVAVERVRAEAMAMHTSEDFEKVNRVLWDQVSNLDVTGFAGAGIVLFDDDGYVTWWDFSSPGNIGQHEAKLTRYKHDKYTLLGKEIWNTYKSKKPYVILEYDLPRLKEAVKEWKQINPAIAKEFQKAIGAGELTYQWGACGRITNGFLTFDHLQEPDKDSKLILIKMANAFDLAYQRFLDLQKAEAQTRESQIEAALERVRSKAMAMRSSKDIGEATTVLFNEIEKLGMEAMRCGILIIQENKVMDVWTTSTTNNDEIISVSGQIDMTIHPLLEGVFDGWKSGVPQTQYELAGKDGESYYQAIRGELSYKLPISHITKLRHFNTCFMFNEGALFAFTKNEISDSSGKIYSRFAKVFGLTYQRYRELIESEKREKEANKQSSLDRVRGEIASMRSTEDLNRITPIIWHELTNLGVPFFRCGIFIIEEEKQNIQVFLSDPSGKSLGLMNLDFTTSELTKNSVSAWQQKEVYKTHWNREEFIQWTLSLKDLGKIETSEGYQGSDEAPESLHLHFVPFSQGMLYVGNLEPLNKEQIDLVRNLSESFSIAYSRYEDFTKLEQAFSDLKTTQKQLIQSEKMASLGELTAGIAHEIQNPLNFVNNFSEVSNELIDEMNEEIEKGDLEEARFIANDIKQNLEKINHHGKRADAIVKGMLQHSRKSTAEKELTDINKLADEYLRLAYHGLRAKDKSFNATLETDFDENMDMIHVIPQDIGRVILNLITNAFYACNERKKKSMEADLAYDNTSASKYNPTVFIRTLTEKNNIKITVKDNADGIPKDVIDKIFQPFFTTKPTGEGTGLGLSLSYDIVTKGHGGDLKVHAEEGIGTTFTIELPNNNSKN
ncbi:ATP-binding protein [Portibacter marinus]|uniref:ATP-binding protein n=1 Tax=Portibacter marinus TaxID=2898660 RepID=UPI001F20178B|nr:ATP-binding protein [Portibacter marinus]